MVRWVKQLREERQGISPKSQSMTPEQIEIRALKKGFSALNIGCLEKSILIQQTG